MVGRGGADRARVGRPQSGKAGVGHDVTGVAPSGPGGVVQHRAGQSRAPRGPGHVVWSRAGRGRGWGAVQGALGDCGGTRGSDPRER
jgi:hypothetical protein